MNGPAWVFLTAWWATMLLLAIACGGNADLSKENRRLRRALTKAQQPAGPAPLFDATLADILALPEAPTPLVECPSCDGRGAHENDGPGILWATCQTCEGLGTVDARLVEPDQRPVDIDACGRCDGQGMFVDVIEGEAGWVTCGWCSGAGVRGPGRGWTA